MTFWYWAPPAKEDEAAAWAKQRRYGIEPSQVARAAVARAAGISEEAYPQVAALAPSAPIRATQAQRALQRYKLPHGKAEELKVVPMPKVCTCVLARGVCTCGLNVKGVRVGKWGQCLRGLRLGFGGGADGQSGLGSAAVSLPKAGCHTKAAWVPGALVCYLS